VFGDLDSTKDALDLLDALATLPKLNYLKIGPVIRSEEVKAAVKALEEARPDMDVRSKRDW
jgi:hypothetical protein